VRAGHHLGQVRSTGKARRRTRCGPRELRPKELRQADVLNEFVSVGTDAA